MSKLPIPPRPGSMFAAIIDYSEPALKRRLATAKAREKVAAEVAASWAVPVFQPVKSGWLGQEGLKAEDVNKTFVGVRLPSNLVAEIDSLAKSEEITRSEAIRDMLRKYLDFIGGG